MEQFFADTSVLLLIINCLLYIRSFSSYGKAFKLFTWYLLAILFVEVSMRIYSHYGYNNLFISHFYFSFQFVLLSIFYLKLLKGKQERKAIKGYIVLCYSTLVIQYVFSSKMFFKFNLFEIFITSFPIVIYSMVYFYNMLNDKKEFYYVNMGVLIYITGSTIIFLSGNIINLYSAKFARSCWTFNSILYLFYQILIFIEWKKNYSKISKG